MKGKKGREEKKGREGREGREQEGREGKERASLYQELSGFVFLTDPLSCGFSPHLDQSLFCYMSIVLYVKSKLYLSFQKITGSQGYIKKKKLM